MSSSSASHGAYVAPLAVALLIPPPGDRFAGMLLLVAAVVVVVAVVVVWLSCWLTQAERCAALATPVA